jgi:hypothetical protein
LVRCTKEFVVIAFIERFLEGLMRPYAEELARLPDQAFRQILARL